MGQEMLLFAGVVGRHQAGVVLEELVREEHGGGGTVSLEGHPV